MTLYVIRRTLAIIVCIFLSLSLSQTSISIAQSFPYVTALQWSPDGSKVAMVNSEAIQIFDTNTHVSIYELKGHEGEILAINWNSDSTLLASGGVDQTVRIWDTTDGALIHTLLGHNDTVVSVTWTPDGTQLVSSAFDNQPLLFVWDVQSGELMSKHIAGTIADSAFSFTGDLFAYVAGSALEIRDANTFEITAVFRESVCCSNIMYALDWNRSGRSLVTGSTSGLLTLWDTDLAQIQSQILANPYANEDALAIESLALSWVRDVSFSPDGSSILAVSGDGTVREWDINNPEVFIETQIGALATASWSPYGGRLAVVDLTLKDGSTLTDLQAFDSNDLAGQITMVVPFSDKDRIEKLAETCAMPSNVLQQIKTDLQSDKISDVIARVEAIDKSQIQPACAADLIAVAEAILAAQDE